MYAYAPGEVAAANASEALGETQALRARVLELERKVEMLMQASLELEQLCLSKQCQHTWTWT